MVARRRHDFRDLDGQRDTLPDRPSRAAGVDFTRWSRAFSDR